MKAASVESIEFADMPVRAVFTAAICLIAGGIVLATVFAPHAAKPFTGFIDAVYFGGNRQDEDPPLNLRLPRAYRAERCFQKAIDECERQLTWHSLSPELWAELLLAQRGGSGTRGGHAETTARQRALECLGMVAMADRFDKIVRDRERLPAFPPEYQSQFER
jgi:hypothetical protein